jgi:hypothetical protein
MLLKLFRRAPAAVAGRICCYGKLPFDREFLRFHLETPGGRWLVAWVDGAHQVISASAERYANAEGVELRAVVSLDGGRSALAALIRASSDGGGRTYPIAVFAVHDARALRGQWHLVPLWVASQWAAIERSVLGPPIADRAALAAALDAATPALVAGDVLTQRFEAATRESVASPWRSLLGLDEARAREVAVTLVQLGKTQRDAREREEGIAVRVPLVNGLGASLDGAMQVATWIRLVGAPRGSLEPWPGIVEVWRRGEGAPQSACIFGREPTPADLAHLLASVGDSSIDDVTEPWGTEPTADWARTIVDGLLSDRAHCMADLWGSASVEV